MSANPNALMQQAQQTMQNPLSQSVPQMPGQDMSQHPIVQAIIKAISGGAQSYGWTGINPEERMQRQQMDSQKAETMARLAQTGEYQQGELQNRQTLATIAGQNADTKQKDEASKEETRKSQIDINNQKLELAQSANEWKKAMSEGRLQQAKDMMSQKAAQFEQTFKLRAQQVGIEQAKLELSEQGLQIKKGFLDLAGVAVQQKGTSEGLNTLTKLQGLAYEHPILSQVFGMEDVKGAVGQAQAAGIPGTPSAPTAGAPQQAAPTKAGALAKKNSTKAAGKPGDPIGIL